MHSRIKSFRLGESMVKSLERVCRRRHISENAFVCGTLRWRIEVEPLIPAFGGILLSDSVFDSILMLADEDKLEAVARDLGEKHFLVARELFQSSGEELTYSKFLNSILDNHGRWFSVEGDAGADSSVVLLRHNHTEKWSAFLRGYLAGAYGVVAHEALHIDTTDGLVKLGFARRPVVRNYSF